MDHQKNRKLAVLATDGFAEIELKEAMSWFNSFGNQVEIVSDKDSIKAWNQSGWSGEYKVDKLLNDANPGDYDALVLPGGNICPNKLRDSKKAIDFIKCFYYFNKPIASICNGPLLLIEADIVRGKKITSFHSIKTDLQNAGAIWIDEDVVVDGNLISSRGSDDLEAFVNKIYQSFYLVTS